MNSTPVKLSITILTVTFSNSLMELPNFQLLC